MSVLRRRPMAWAYDEFCCAQNVAQALTDLGLGITAKVTCPNDGQWCVAASVPTRPIYAAAAPDPDDDDDYHVDSRYDRERYER